MLDDQTAYRLTISGIDVDRDLIACCSGADGGVIDIEGHGTVSGVDIGSNAVLLGAVVVTTVVAAVVIAAVAAAGTGITSIAAVSGVARIAGIAGAAGSNGSDYRNVEGAAGPDLCKVAGVVQRLKQLGVLAIVNTVACDHVVSGLS